MGWRWEDRHASLDRAAPASITRLRRYSARLPFTSPYRSHVTRPVPISSKAATACASHR